MCQFVLRFSLSGKIEFLVEGYRRGLELALAFLCRSPEGILKHEIYGLFTLSFLLPPSAERHLAYMSHLV